jgi:hypothetical protein
LALTLAACGSGSGGGGGSGGGNGSGGGSSSASGSGGGGGSGTGGNGSGGGGDCTTGSDSTLPGVAIEFTTADCTYTLAEAAAGIEIGYRVVAAADVPNVVPTPQDAGGCGKPGPSGLIPFAKLEGNNQSYCICDEGICPSNPSAVTVPAGSYPGTFAWDGVNWTGPSDFGNPKGEPFPPGDYTLTVSAIGKWDDAGTQKDFSVKGTFVVHLVP